MKAEDPEKNNEIIGGAVKHCWQMELNEITGEIIGAAIEVHRVMGPGLLESAYEACLACELRTRGLKVEQQQSVALVYRETKLECGYRMDTKVEDRIIVEVKSVDGVLPVHEARLFPTYDSPTSRSASSSTSMLNS
jgi:GxxExxY protein